MKLTEAVRSKKVTVVALFYEQFAVNRTLCPVADAHVHHNRALLRQASLETAQEKEKDGDLRAPLRSHDALSGTQRAAAGPADSEFPPAAGGACELRPPDAALAPRAALAHVRALVRSFFQHYDRNRDGLLDSAEFPLLMSDLGHPMEASDLDAYFSEVDRNRDGHISFEEFLVWLPDFISRYPREHAQHMNRRRSTLLAGAGRPQAPTLSGRPARSAARDNAPGEPERGAGQARNGAGRVEEKVDLEGGAAPHESGAWLARELSSEAEASEETEEHEEEEEEELEEHFMVKDPTTGQMVVDYAKVKRSAFAEMIWGTALVLLFSDPVVGALSEIGRRTGVPAFYISFVVAPLASNASELVASIYYAGKKTRTTATVSLTALEGAAIMNNTFCLFIFCVIIYCKDLAWSFSAETMSILLVELAMFFVARQKVQRLWHALLALSLYPLSLVFIVVCQTSLGLD
jgi:Ca2+/Na+ antiporter